MPKALPGTIQAESLSEPSPPPACERRFIRRGILLRPWSPNPLLHLYPLLSLFLALLLRADRPLNRHHERYHLGPPSNIVPAFIRPGFFPPYPHSYPPPTPARR